MDELTTIETINGNWNSTKGAYKIYVGGFTWYVNTPEEIQARIDQFRSQIVGKTVMIWNNKTHKLIREGVVSA